MANNEIIFNLYRETNIPCDSLISSPIDMESFTLRYNKLTNDNLSAKEMAKKLLGLRKKGQDNGGLPRLRK